MGKDKKAKTPENHGSTSVPSTIDPSLPAGPGEEQTDGHIEGHVVTQQPQ